ncbi:MTOR-associated protein MEAK7-like [Myxocyprinus asiaticus]|uniref:MTOR-associated protein MEAK7-like n=1 Tax=Myxocyprinus asiaticus TaxID=70543 RepID=UPI00222223DF|nr:MTOR-associated protein MEAK7-like [Myxocyprinus asiaticus]XP_051513123.1 MTOR-associated protein MEAK7-like [Myxocyprinus asiaticus]XP_051513124.1 MTOR-associated protein MEAK7-like [Myxocyprinus asiaticus]XP_051513125.1 MTOR-associated protein MEAK7-like [Myxocyprinus asiaticus]
MGNTDSVVVQKRLARFRPDERPVIDGVFDRLHGTGSSVSSGKTGKILSLDMLKMSMGKMASESMIKRVFQGIHSVDPGVPLPSGGGVSREQLVIFLADILRGTAEERAPLVLAMAEEAKATAAATEQIRGLVEDLVSAAIQTLIYRGHLRAWQPDRMGDGPQGARLLAEQLTSELKFSDKNMCDIPCLEDWLFRIPAMAMFLELLIGEGLGIGLPSRPPPTLLPQCRYAPWSDLHCLLHLPLLMFLSPQLPAGYSAPWRLLFSTNLHGESFTRLVGNCKGQGPTVLLIKDTKGHIFGGFASQSWEVKPQFQGDSRCFLFSVFPFMRVFTCTGYNNHYMYLNQGQQTMPNGLGMGGQHGYFGLWLDSDFGHGHSRARPRCTTYGSYQLSGEEDFKVDTLEVWGVGQPREEQEQDENKKSILDADPEVQAIMEMTGKTLHSQGLREPEEDEG